MQLATFLEKQRESILGKWFDSIIATYPSGSAEFLSKQRDQFRNPVGHTTRTSIEVVYDEIITSMNIDELRRALDGIIRIRAVQDFTASEAVAFVFGLKPLLRNALRDHLGDDLYNHENSNEMADLDARIDRVAVLAFDKYMECRDKLHEVRTNEIRNRSVKLIDRLGTSPCVSDCKGELGVSDCKGEPANGDT